MFTNLRLISVATATFAACVLIGIVEAPLEGIGRPAINPIPCAQRTWEYDDASFDALPGATALSGRYAGGTYRIEIPKNWNHDLVLYSRGFVDNTGPQGGRVRVSNPPIRQHLVQQGYAWAASSYRCNGYIPGIGLEDTVALLGQFEASSAAPPQRVYLAGTSMGGHVSLLAMQQLPTAFAGALAMCPSGPELFDYFASVEAAAEVITGVQLKRSDTRSNLAQMIGLLGVPPTYTEKGRQLASVEIEISGGPRPFAMEGLAQRFIQNIGVFPESGGSSLLEQAATNEHIDYRIDSTLGLSADFLNSTVRRKHADVRFRNFSSAYQELMPFNGRIERPVLTMHGTGDLYVPIHLEQALRDAVTAAKRQQWLVQRAYRIPGHCTFNLAEQSRSFDDLVAWVRDGVRPAGDDFASLLDAGRQFTSPIRPNDPGTVRVVPVSK